MAMSNSEKKKTQQPTKSLFNSTGLFGAVTKEISECPSCNVRLQKENGELYCGECGYVSEDAQIDYGQEWRGEHSSSHNSQARRTGQPLTHKQTDKGLSTAIGHISPTEFNRFSSRKKHQISRMKNLHRRSRAESTRERTKFKGLKEIERVCAALGLATSIEETASILLQQIVENQLTVGRSIEVIAMASIYLASRIEEQPQFFEDLEPVSRVDTDRIKKASRTLQEELPIGIKPTRPRKYIPRFGSELELPQQLITKALEIEAVVWESDAPIRGSPKTYATSCLYTASVLEGTVVRQCDFNKAITSSPRSIRRVTKIILKELPEPELDDTDMDDIAINTLLSDLHDGEHTYIQIE